MVVQQCEQPCGGAECSIDVARSQAKASEDYETVPSESGVDAARHVSLSVGWECLVAVVWSVHERAQVDDARAMFRQWHICLTVWLALVEAGCSQ